MNALLTGRRFSDWPFAVKSILGFWIAYALTIVIRAALAADPLTLVQNKLINVAIGVILTGLVYVAIVLFGNGRANVRRKAIVAGIASAVAACSMAWFLLLAQDLMRESQEEYRYEAREGIVLVGRGQQVRIERRAADPLVLTLPKVSELDRTMQIRMLSETAVIWVFFFLAWSAFYLAWLAQRQALDAQARAMQAESAARAAQVRALRYQVNPHFLFNTLNSLSSLVMNARPEEAETMILKLSKFFRSSLSLDASADVTLAEEIALQQLYLDIEKVRFPRRLKVEIDVPQELEGARLPALILQPVVENAIKYGVSQTRDIVTLRIGAHEIHPGRLRIEVVNSGASHARRSDSPGGTGVGLNNVCQRLSTRFGDAAECEFGPTADGGYRVAMTLPLDRTDG